MSRLAHALVTACVMRGGGADKADSSERGQEAHTFACAGSHEQHDERGGRCSEWEAKVWVSNVHSIGWWVQMAAPAPIQYPDKV